MSVSIYESEQYQAAQQAYGGRRFADAERIAQSMLAVVADVESREILYDLLFFIYSNPLNEKPDRAQACLETKELLRQSAQNAMQWAQFMLFCRESRREAAKWADVAIKRSEQESDRRTEYTAVAFRGLVAAKESDKGTVRRMLAKIAAFAVGDDLPFGDEVSFFEAANALGEEFHENVRDVCLLIVPKIRDPEFRQRVARLAAQPS